MSVRTLSVTVQISCDSIGCDSIQLRFTVTSIAEALSAAKARGWTLRRVGYDRWECPRCSRRTARLIAAGVINRQGIILDEDRYEQLAAVSQ